MEAETCLLLLKSKYIFYNICVEKEKVKESLIKITGKSHDCDRLILDFFFFYMESTG